MVGEWAAEVQVDRDLDTSGAMQDVHELLHNDRECYQLTIGEMNDSELMKNHISKKVLDPDAHLALKQSEFFVVDPLCAWGLRSDNIKVKKARKKFEQMSAEGKQEEFFNTESLRDVVSFYALDKYKVSTVIAEKANCKPHIVIRDVATRLVFETFDGSFVQVAQEMELLVFLWPDKRRKEDYFYKEIGKFRETCQKLFKGVIANLMKMRNSPLRFTPRDRPFDKTG